MAEELTTCEKFLFQPLTSKYLHGACEVIKNALFIPGSLNAALGIPQDPDALSELEQLARITARDGVSVVAIDTNTDKVAGVAFNKFWHKSDRLLENLRKTWKNEKSLQILDMIIKTENMCDIFELLNVDCVMEIFLLGTSNEYRKQGIAKKLCQYSFENAQKLFDGINIKQPIDGNQLPLEPTPKAVTTIFNSPISQKIGRQLGLIIAAERSNAKIELMGKTLEIPGETTTTTLEYKKLNNKNI